MLVLVCLHSKTYSESLISVIAQDLGAAACVGEGIVHVEAPALFRADWDCGK